MDEEHGWGLADDDSEDDFLPDPDVVEGVCAGECLSVPQFPFNPKILLVWIGNASAVPECPEIAPEHGFEGTVVSMSSMPGGRGSMSDPRVQECLFWSGGEGCNAGKLCAPLPPEPFRRCVAREVDGLCQGQDYPDHIVVREGFSPETGPEVTLCCEPLSVVR